MQNIPENLTKTVKPQGMALSDPLRDQIGYQ